MAPLIYLKQVDSTNNYLKGWVSQQKVEEGTVIYTYFQSAGKGQRGNSWESEDGKNILFSIILYPDMIDANEQFIVSQIVSLAIVEVIQSKLNTKHKDSITIKWPNDIYWKNKKLCGILIENSLIGSNIKESIIGIGININQTKFESNAPNPISLKQITGQDYELETLLAELQKKIMEYYTGFINKKTNLNKHYKDTLFRNKGFHLYNDGETNFNAKIKDIEPSGILVLETEDGEIRRFAFKEVSYILN